MVSDTDFTTLKYTPDLTQAGIAYVCKRLWQIENQLVESEIEHLWHLIGEVGSELAFRRYLTREKIPYTNLETKPFSDPDRYTVTLGGRRCKFASTLLTHEDLIRQVRVNPSVLLDTQALVSKEQSTYSHLSPEDIYIFTFVNALVTPDLQTINRALRAKQPIFLMHTPPTTWSSVGRGVSLGNLTLESENNPSIKIDVNGLDLDRLAKTETVEVGRGGKKQLMDEYYTLNYLSSHDLPDKSIRMHSSSLGKTHFIMPGDWNNLWVYGLEIIFTGYLVQKEFHNRANILPPINQVFQDEYAQVEQLGIPIRELKPLSHLFEHAKSWRKSKLSS